MIRIPNLYYKIISKFYINHLSHTHTHTFLIDIIIMKYFYSENVSNNSMSTVRKLDKFMTSTWS